MRRPFIAGNWKLNQTIAESRELAQQLVENLAGVEDRDIVVAPVFTALSTVAEVIKNSPIQLAAQNCYPQTQGAFTGEVSPLLLQDVGCNYLILGHSERRQLMGETDNFINLKLLKTLEAGLKPILCVGETLQEREEKQMLKVLTRQISGGLDTLTAEQMVGVVIAYEPIWAIGTGKTATDDRRRMLMRLSAICFRNYSTLKLQQKHEYSTEGVSSLTMLMAYWLRKISMVHWLVGRV